MKTDLVVGDRVIAPGDVEKIAGVIVEFYGPHRSYAVVEIPVEGLQAIRASYPVSILEPQ